MVAEILKMIEKMLKNPKEILKNPEEILKNPDRNSYISKSVIKKYLNLLKSLNKIFTGNKTIITFLKNLLAKNATAKEICDYYNIEPLAKGNKETLVIN